MKNNQSVYSKINFELLETQKYLATQSQKDLTANEKMEFRQVCRDLQNLAKFLESQV